MKAWRTIPLVCAVLALTSSAWADVESAVHTQDGDNYAFKDELVNSGVSFPSGIGIKVRPMPKRVMLIRPRGSFVKEMLKSVEHM